MDLWEGSVQYGTVEPFAKGKSIHHMIPQLTAFNVTGPHSVVLVFLSAIDGEFW